MVVEGCGGAELLTGGAEGEPQLVSAASKSANDARAYSTIGEAAVRGSMLEQGIANRRA